MGDACRFCKLFEQCLDENLDMEDTYMKYYCDEFTPTNADDDDRYMSEYIENERIAFREDWFRYSEYYEF